MTERPNNPQPTPVLAALALACAALCAACTSHQELSQDDADPVPDVGYPAPAGAGASLPDREGGRNLTDDEMEALAAKIDALDRSDAEFDWQAVRRLKSQYHLFNPTPRLLRREFITDRPDKTINPVTVDAGHFQVETDLAIATLDRYQDLHDYSFLLTNVRIGLLNNTDMHLIFRPLQQRATTPEAGQTHSAFGFGDMRVLLKENLWGNEGGPTAFSFTQYLDIPTGYSGLSTGVVEGGATGAFLARFPRKTYFGFETGVDWRKDKLENRYHVGVPASVSIAYSFTKKLSSKAEFASVVSTRPGAEWVGVLALASLYDLGDDAQFDIGINIGLTPAANDWNPYIGWAKRF